jgi:hypothetical protein
MTNSSVNNSANNLLRCSLQEGFDKVNNGYSTKNVESASVYRGLIKQDGKGRYTLETKMGVHLDTKKIMIRPGQINNWCHINMDFVIELTCWSKPIFIRGEYRGVLITRITNLVAL